MVHRLLSMIDPPPAGFKRQEVLKRDLLAGAVAVYCESAELLYPLVDFFTARVAGVVIVPGDGFRQEQLGPLLWRMTLPTRLQSAMRVLVEPLLAAIETALAQREKAVELGGTLNRLRYDLDTVRGDYLRVTAKLQSQVLQLVETQSELVQGEAELRAIFDLLPQQIYATNEEGRLLLVNAAFARAQGAEYPAALCGQLEADLHLPARWLAESTRIDSQIRQGSEAQYLPELKVVCPDGDVLYFEAIKLPWRSGGYAAVLNVLHDISARHAVEQQMASLNEELERRVIQRTTELEQANRELEAFSYSVSHDLRAPLRAVMGFSQILESEAAPRLEADERDMLQRIQAAALRMSQLIDDLLGLAQTARMTLNPVALDVAAIANVVWRDFGHMRQGRQLAFDCEATMPAQADARMLRLVLEQLLANAIKFTRHRETATVSVGRRQLGDEWAYFVRDNGAGFDMARANQLFAPFQRLHSTVEFEGNGIGLATAQRVISRHGGRIWAEAKPEVGATFWFTLASG